MDMGPICSTKLDPTNFLNDPTQPKQTERNTVQHYRTVLCQQQNESVPKIIINDTKILFNSISILVISNNDSFRVLFDKIALFYFMRKWPAQETSTVPIVSAHFRSLYSGHTTVLDGFDESGLLYNKYKSCCYNLLSRKMCRLSNAFDRDLLK